MGIFRKRKTFDRLNEMIDSANKGTFQESAYDETQLSQLEVKWKRFLGSSALSYEKVEKERASIKGLVSDISHQTKTPLSNILLYSQLLKEKELDEESRELVKRIELQSEKLGFLVQALVKMSRLETGVLQLEPRNQLVMPMLAQACATVEEKAREKDVRIQRSGEETLKACFDKKWTQEALCNVLDNGVKYSGKGSGIHVTVKNYEMFVRIDIRDTGIGIAEEEINKIFQRFYRGSRVQQEEGIGVGLYLTREIIGREKGYIKVSSKVGEGTCFSIYLKKEED